MCMLVRMYVYFSLYIGTPLKTTHTWGQLCVEKTVGCRYVNYFRTFVELSVLRLTLISPAIYSTI